MNTQKYTDIKRLVWIEQYLPARLRPYAYLMRIDRPVGIWLLLLPGLWGIVLASGGVVGMGAREYIYVALFFVGAIIMRGAGCAVNDLWDRDLDKKVERTKSRPIASGAISSRGGVVFLCVLLVLGLVILLQFNAITILLGLLVVPLIVAYPLMKRITWWPQVFLGVVFNFSALMGWSAVSGDIGLPAVFLYLGGIFWTIGYDTIYAHQDKEDDALAGIKSTALSFGSSSKHWVIGFYGGAMLFLFAAMALVNGVLAAAIFLFIAAPHLIWQVRIWEKDSKISSLRVFKSNTCFGALTLLAFYLAFIMQYI